MADETIIKEGIKPISGAPSNFWQGGTIRKTDDEGRIVDTKISGAPLDTANVVSKQEYEAPVRLGDYYYDRSGNLSVVPNSPTDIFQKWKYTTDTSLYEKPTRESISNEGLLAPLISTGAVGAYTGIKGGLGALAGSTAALLPALAIGGVVSAQQAGAQEKAYRDALAEWQKSQDRAVWKVAGNLTTDENGRIYFTPDASKAITMNAAFAGSELQEAFNKETNVFFGDDGRLKVEVNPVYAATDEYKELADRISQGYSGLTRDSEGSAEAIEEIKQYISTANNQFKFREQSKYSYKSQIPGASDATIEDAYTNEIGAYMSEKDGGDYDVKVYRDGKIETETAQKVLENVYSKDLGGRSDYMLDLFSKMDDPSISDDDKVYILSEIKMLYAADGNDTTYDNGQKDENGVVVKTRNKYYGMLDQESIISALNNYQVVFGVSVSDAINAIDAITPWNMHISKQEGLQEDPAAASAARLISTATSAIVSWKIMQGIEHGMVRPLAAKLGEIVSSGWNGFLERLAANGGRLSEAVGEAQMAVGSLGNSFAQLTEGARLTASPLVKTLGFSMGELLYNATSDLAFDAGKQLVKALSGQEPTAGDFLEDFGVDLAMDLVLQYGPAGLSQVQTELDNYRLDAAYAPYRAGVEGALKTMDAAELEYNTVKAEVADMRNGTKKYKEAEATLAEKEEAYNAAKENYDRLYEEAQTAVKEAMPSMSEELGAKLAGKIADVEQNNVIMWLRKKLTDEKAGLSTIAEQAYARTGDVYLYQAAINKFQNIQAGIKEVTVKMLSDFYAKGTGRTYTDFANAYITAAPKGKLSRTQIEYLVARAEYDAWSRTAKGNDELMAQVEEKYLPYINRVQGVDKDQLDNMLEAMRGWLRKVGESYVKSGAATKKQVQDIESAALGSGYIPLWGKDVRTQKFGIFETPLTLKVGRTFDESQGLFDVEGVRNPVESALSYAHNVINNIARNEMAAMLKDIASIDGVGVELVGEGAPNAGKYQDIIEEAIAKVATSKEQMLKNEVSPEKYQSGLEKVLSTSKNEAAIRGIDELIESQKQLQKLVETNNALGGPQRDVDDRYSGLAKKAKNYKTPERFESMNNPIKGSEIWGEKPKGIFERDGRAVRVNMFPNDSVRGTGITRQYLLNLFREAYDQGITRIVPSYGSYTKDGESFMDHLAEQGWLNVERGAGGYKSYSISSKIGEWTPTRPLIDIYNKAHALVDDGAVKRIIKISELDTKIKEQKSQIRLDIDSRIRAAGEYFNKTYKPYGISVDIENTLTSSKYINMIDSKLNSLSTENLIRLKDDVARTIGQMAPYLPANKIDQKVLNKQAAGVKVHALNRIKKEQPDLPAREQNKMANQVVENFKAQATGDYSMYNTMDDRADISGAHKINFTVDGKDASFYIKGKMAREVAAEMTTKNVNDRRAVSEFFKEAANIKRLLTTGIDPTRVIPNLLRDTLRNGIMSGGTDYWFFDNSPFGFQSMFTKMATAAGDTEEQITKALKVLQASQEVASGATYNEAVNGRRTTSVKRLAESSTQVGDNRGVRFIWELAHDKKALLEAPMNWAEGLTRNRAASSAFTRAYMRGGGTLDYETRLSNAYEAGVNAARENTVNFMRRGTFIKEISAYVPYLSQKFSNIESTKIALLKDPIGVSSRVMMFGAAYMAELSRVLADERSRRNYYNLSEYDRENNIILSLGGDGSLVTIPLDESISALIYPWRRGLETMHNVDPENFYKIMVNGFLELSPFDLSGFTEGDSFNFGRGLEKLGAQMLPTLLQAAYSGVSGRSMYYGSNIQVTKDDLAEYGNYNPTAGDYTTVGKNSALLRAISDAFGIEQWRLQQLVADLGGNVGQYVVNWLDKIAGAPEDAQGGKEFVDATFKSFTGMDSEQVRYAFNDGLAELKQEKEKVMGRLKNVNSQISLASGERLSELQEEYKEIKQGFAMKVGNFVDKYINAYEIAGGLERSQASQLWYLFNFSDDDSLAMAGSVEAYHRDLAKKQANNEATRYSASVLDKYYDQTKNVYKDSSGQWHYYSPYGEQAFFNTIQGRGMEYQIGLRNLIEGDLTNLSSERSAAYDAREAAYQAKNWDEYDKIGLRFDDKIIETIAPYVKRYGAEKVLTNSSVLDYLEEWFFVPSSYMKSKYGKNVSLAHNASKQRAFVRPYIKELFGLGTGYQDNNYVSRPENLVRGEQ